MVQVQVGPPYCIKPNALKNGRLVTMFDTLIIPLIKLTTDVGEMILSLYKSNIEVKIKADQTPLTIADQTAHQLILKGLKKLTPDTPVLSEESETIAFDERSNWQTYWLIDPLDGTRDFIQHTGEFCICIAYIKHHSPIFGMIYAPLTHTHYYTLNGKTIKLQNNVEQILQTRRPSNPLKIVIGHNSSYNQQLKNHLKKQIDYQLTRLGSALKFCEIAEGNYDYYPRFGPCSEWDTAAGTAILQTAGGCVVDENGGALRYNTKDDLLSPVFFASGVDSNKY